MNICGKTDTIYTFSGMITMKKILLSLLMIMPLSAMADNTSANILQKTPNWGLVRAGTACIEHYQFLPSGEVKIESNLERVTGRYSFIEKQTGFELPAVVISFETDNKQPDCANDRTDQTGTASTIFLKKESDQKIFFCLDALGKSCPVYIKPMK